MKDKEVSREFETLLAHSGINDPSLFSEIKFSGATKKDDSRFVGWIPYLAHRGKISVIVVPYRRKDYKEGLLEKPEGESDIETILREAEEEVGIRPNVEKLWEVCRQDTGSFSISHDKHTRIFYAGAIRSNDLKYLRSFPGYNRYDEEKGRPILVKLEEAWKFLSTAHLFATFDFLKKVRAQDSEIILNVGYLEDLLGKIQSETEARTNKDHVEA